MAAPTLSAALAGAIALALPSTTRRGSGDPVLDAMRRRGVPETRENYIDFAYDDKTMSEERTAEHEMALPEHLQQSGTNEMTVATPNSRRPDPCCPTRL